jgi:hypothetical protein
MVFVTNNPKWIVVSMLCSIAIAAFIYFVIVKPETDKASDTVNRSLQQAQPSIDRANSIQDCVLRAGGDAEKLAACNK